VSIDRGKATTQHFSQEIWNQGRFLKSVEAAGEQSGKITLLLLVTFSDTYISNYLIKWMKCVSLRCANGTGCSDFPFVL